MVPNFTFSGINISRYSWVFMIVLMVFATGNGTDSSANRALYDLRVNWMLNNVKFRSGDLIFRRGKSFESEAVLLTDRNSRYSHVGLLFLLKGKPYVIHAVPYETGQGRDEMKCEELGSFISFDKASRAAVYRVGGMSDAGLEKAVGWAKKAFDTRVEFDGDYSLVSDDKLYCTELIWKSYRAAGIDLVKGHFDVLNLPLKGGNYILPGRLIMNPLLKKIQSL